MKDFKRYTITSALPYANGPVHIGHLAGVYIPADIYARYLRGKGKDVVFIGGSDEHGVPITIKAKNEGVSPQDIVDKYHGIIKKSFADLGISFDIYSVDKFALVIDVKFTNVFDKIKSGLLKLCVYLSFSSSVIPSAASTVILVIVLELTKLDTTSFSIRTDNSKGLLSVL